MTRAPDDVLRLIGLVYQAVDGPEGWDPFITEYRRVSGLQAATLTVRRGIDQHFQLAAAYGFDDTHFAEFNEHVVVVNPFQVHADRQPLGHTTRAGASLVPRREFLSSAFYDWMARIGTEDILLSLEKLSEGRMASFDGFTPAGTRVEEHHVELVRTLAPHVFHAVSLSEQLARLKTQHVLSCEALSRADFGCVFLDERGRVEWMNDYAVHLIERSDVLQLAGDELLARHPQAHQVLTAALKAALRISDGEIGPVAPIVALERPGGRPVEALISPTRAFSHGLLGRSRGALVLLADPEHVDESFADRLQTLHRLTPTEAEVAQWLLSGVSVNRIAEIFGNSVHTIRTHVKRLLVKCGASSQAQLVGVLQRSLARLA